MLRISMFVAYIKHLWTSAQDDKVYIIYKQCIKNSQLFPTKQTLQIPSTLFQVGLTYTLVGMFLLRHKGKWVG